MTRNSALTMLSERCILTIQMVIAKYILWYPHLAFQRKMRLQIKTWKAFTCRPFEALGLEKTPPVFHGQVKYLETYTLDWKRH